jgi:hypothetical protein
MKRSLVSLIFSALLLGLGWLIPHSLFSVTLETPTATPAPTQASTSTPLPFDLTLPAPLADATATSTPFPMRDPLGELYFTLVGSAQGPRLVRLPGSCVVGQTPCPAPETVHTPFNTQEIFSNVPEGLAWSQDGRWGVLVTHPEDELSRGRTKEELDQLQTQAPADFQIATSTIYLLDADNDTWSEIYHADRKYIYPPVWSADGQWLAFGVRSSVWAFHPIQPDDGIYIIHPDGSGLKQIANIDATLLGWIGNSVAVQQTTRPYPNLDYVIEMIAIDGQVSTLFRSTRMAYYQLAPDGGALFVTDAQGENSGGPQKSAELLALDGSVTHTFGVYSNMTQSIWAAAWSQDSSQLAYANLRRVYVASRTGEPHEIYLADDTFVEPSIWNMQFSPDQKFLLLDVYDGVPKLVVASLETNQSTPLTWAGMSLDEQAVKFSWRP